MTYERDYIGKRLFLHGKFVPLAVLLIMFLCGLIVCGDYGVFWDEKIEMGQILPENLKQILLDFNISESKYFEVFRDVSGIRDSVERDHGVALYYILAPTFIGDCSARTFHILFSIWTYCISFSSVVALYLIGKELFRDWRLALAGAALYFLSPKIFAESHYNSKDIVFLALEVNMSLFALRAAKRKNPWDMIAFAVISAFACNVKIIGFYFFAVLGQGYILYTALDSTQQWTGKNIALTAGTVLLTFAVFLLITPATWKGNILSYFQYNLAEMSSFSRWAGLVIFNGNEYFVPYEYLPRCYLPIQILITTPLLVVFLAVMGVVGGIASLVRCLQGKESDRINNVCDSLFLLVFIAESLVPVLVSVLTRATLYNGWRHAYFCEFAVILLAMCGMQFFAGKIPIKWCATLLGAGVLVMTVRLVMNHPYQYCCYNILAGSDAQQRYEMDYWNVTTTKVLEDLCRDDTNDKIAVCALENYTRQGIEDALPVLSDNDRDRIIIAEDYDNSDYILINYTYSRRILDKIPSDAELCKIYSSWGDEIYYVYKSHSEPGVVQQS